MQHQTIMIIDDDQDDRDFFFEALMEVDSTVGFLAAPNGIEAIKFLKQLILKTPTMPLLTKNLVHFFFIQSFYYTNENVLSFIFTF